ncbi:MAG: hypothetical protein IPJ54_15290 [Saprospiraceae bacterium]|nr:hypothetical protein [Saprospiraceae bacterium]
MNKLDIDQLLEKFWSAETTEQEEKELKAYFEQAEIDESHTYAAPFFVDFVQDNSGTEDITHLIIQKLIGKYFDATSSQEEEQLIHEYFAQDAIHDDLKCYKGLFRSFQLMGQVQFNKPLMLKQSPASESRIISLTWIRVAAAAVIFVVGGLFLFKSLNQEQSAPMAKARYIEPENPEEALEMTLQALAMVSRKYKKGEEQLLQGMKTMNNAKGAGN